MNMASNVAAPKNTGGGGFVFEDDVCAWLLACMLSSEPVFDEDLGPPLRIDFQTRPDGWFLDDALLTTQRGATWHRFALSIKSNTQFTASAVPSDFVSCVWEQWLHVGSTIFQNGLDFLCLVTAPLSGSAEASISGLVGKVGVADPLTFPSRLATPNWPNEDERNLFSSFICPASLNTNSVTDIDTVRLLQRLRFLQHDFGKPSSESLKRSLKLCRNCVKSKTREDAEILWNFLRGIAAELRPLAGSITLVGLVERLRHRIVLAEYPDYSSDWFALDNRSQRDSTQIADTIAGRVRISREMSLDALINALTTNDLIALLGTSGGGKSAVAKALFERKGASSERTIWLDARTLDCVDFGLFESALHLQNPLKELMKHSASANPILVLDGLDRLYSDNAFRNVAILLKFARQVFPATKWQIVAPCQSQEWPRVLDAIQRAGVIGETWKQLPLQALKVSELKPVGDAMPALHRLLLQPKIGSLLTNLKFLDLVARRIDAGTNVDSSNWVGESSIADWFWSAEIDRGSDRIARGRFVRDLAQRQADELVASVPTDDFKAGELVSLESLAVDQLCIQVPGDRIAFAHDLYGDWARLRILLNNRNNLPMFFKDRHESPLWHRSLRLLGIHLLEHSGGVDDWRSVLASFGQGELGVIHDVFLESPVFAVNARVFLDAVLPDLLKNNGLLLRRLLTRFLAFGTEPNYKIVNLAIALGDNANTARAKYRQPYWPLWLDVIDFLHANRATVLPAAALEIAQLVDMWLDFAPKDSIRRMEAGALAILLGRQALENRNNYDATYSRQEREQFYKCALKSAYEYPDEVTSIVLTSAERFNCSDKAKEKLGLPRRQRRNFKLEETDVMSTPWPNGPQSEVDEAFRNVVLDSPAILDLYKVLPSIAREVVLATLIKEPSDKSWPNHSSIKQEFEIVDMNNWLPPLYTQGPFLGFLNNNFAEGLELIARLVEFVTARASAEKNTEPEENQIVKDVQTVELLLDGGQKRSFYGNEYVYGWSAGLGNSPYPIQTALIALEQYFYQKLDADQDVTAEVAAVFARSNSVAILGVLCDVGKRHPVLFEASLMPLFSAPEIYAWENQKSLHGRDFLMMGAFRHGEVFFNLAKKFHNLEHRKLDLLGIAIKLLFSRPEIREYFNHVRAVWLATLSSSSVITELKKQLDRSLNPANYVVRKDSKHGVVLVNVEEARIQEANIEERRALKDHVSVMYLPMRCRKVLDERQWLDNSQLVELWESFIQVCTLASLSPTLPNGGEGLGDEYANAIAGCVAVFLWHSDWCAEDESRLPNIIAALQEILDAPPKRKMNFDDSIPTWAWECFAAEAVVMLWAQDSSDFELRRLVAENVLTWKYAALQVLFNRMAEFRGKLGKDFAGLRRLVLEWAYVLVRFDMLRQFSSRSLQLEEGVTESMSQEIENWAKEKVDAFVTGYISGMPYNWGECDDISRFSIIETARQRWLGHSGMNFHVVRCAHEWLPLPNDAHDEDERKDIIQFWQSAIEFVVARPKIDLKRRGRQYPEEDERWVLERIGSVLLQLRSDEKPELLWHPVLDLHSEGHHWPTILLQSLHSFALHTEQVGYANLVRALVHYAFINIEGKRRWSSRESVWDSLLGLDVYSQSLWEFRHLAEVKKMKDIFLLWMQQVQLNAQRIATFASWLARPPATLLRLDALQWFRGIVADDSPHRLRNLEETEDDIAKLLNVVWAEEETQLRSDPKAFEAFKFLLGWLGGRQNQFGLELLGRIGNLG
jgi:hypothetical protein